MKELSSTNRYEMIDDIRGLTLLSMVLYHAFWDINNIFGFHINWFDTGLGYIWQQSICWSFIFISGFCWSFGKNQLKHGIVIFMAGLLVSIVTLLFLREERVIFGILTMLGTCMILMVPLEKLLRRIPNVVGIAVSIILFFTFRNINSGYAGFECVNLFSLPEFLYKNYITTFLGFPMDSFFSADYFSIFPWIFLYITGYFCYKTLNRNNFLNKCKRGRLGPLKILGRNSLLIYLFHQPILYFILLVLL